MTAEALCKRCNTPIVEDARFCFGCGVNITDAITGEFELYDLNRFFTYAVDLCCIAGIDGRFKRVNPAFQRVLGWPIEELLTKPFMDFVHPDDQSETMAEVGKLSSGQTTLSFENRYRCKDGSYKHLQWTSYPEPGTGLLYAIAREVS